MTFTNRLTAVLRHFKQKIILFVKIFILKKFKLIDLWFWHDGDNTLRINYPLTENSLVFDLGGYKGDWTAKIFNKYKCYIRVFEPVEEFYNELKLRFSDNQKTKIFNIGLAGRSRVSKIFISVLKIV